VPVPCAATRARNEDKGEVSELAHEAFPQYPDREARSSAREVRRSIR
jgi:hypothetical protein